jgi:trimethylamine monooxygenase
VQEQALEDPIQQIDFQTDYCKDLAKDVVYPGIDLDLIAANFKEWEHHKMHDITTYRNTAYRSGVTGTMAVVHHTPWMEAMDESMICFLGSGGKTRQSAA